MGSCIKALVNEILCEETVVLTHCNKGVAIGELSVPSNSNLAGQTLIRVLDCSPSFHEGLFGVRITLFVQEELELTTPQGRCYPPLEFGFRLQKFCPVMDCYKIDCLERIIEELDCHLRLLNVNNDLVLNRGQTFDQCLQITARVKILREREVHLALCPYCEHIKERKKEVAGDDRPDSRNPAGVSGIYPAWPAYAGGVYLGEAPKQSGTQRGGRRF